MKKQLIISISRQYGSGGHAIAEELAKRFGMPIYDRNMLERIAAEKGGDIEALKKYDEKAKKTFVSRCVRGFSNSPEEVIAEMQFDFLEDKAKSGESFVVVGRCSESLLKPYEGLVSMFITGDEETKCERIMKVRHMTEKEAYVAMERHDKYRKKYHNHHCDTKWGDSRNYDITINSSKLGVDRTVDLLEKYIKERIEV